MAATMNPGVGITREDLELAIEPVISRVAALEAPVVANVEADVVTGSEFRLFKWLGTFALATVVAGFGLLYQQVSDLRVGLERLHTDVLSEIHGLRSEMHAGFASVREDMHTEHESIREDMHTEHESIREDMHAEHESIREDMHTEHESIREDMHAEHESIREVMHTEHSSTREDISGVRERVVRVETLLDGSVEEGR